jgi:tetratricopeptide (TPR) repeat protein
MKLFLTLALCLGLQAHAGDKEEGLKQWALRANKANVEAAVASFEKAHAAAPGDLDVMEYLIRSNFMLGEYFETDAAKKEAFYDKAITWGDKALLSNPEYKKLMDAKKKPEEALSTLTKREVPVAMWRAISLGKRSKLRGAMQSLKFKDEIKGMVGRVGELEPTYYFGGVPRYWGGFYAVAPWIAGGDMKKSKKNFEESLQMAPEYLGTKVLRAEVYWTKEKDKVGFKKDLEEVLASKLDAHKDIGPENALEKKKAAELLKNIDKLF